MFGSPSLFGTDEADFDDEGSFVPEHLPDPGPFLTDADVLTDDDHVAFHGITRDVFEDRSVYDATFGYNLAKLNRDARHPDAGFRYAKESADVLRAEFTPTTEFCPQSDTLCVGAFRAWNGLADRHGYALVRVRVAPGHQRADSINARLRDLERAADADVPIEPVQAVDGVDGGGDCGETTDGTGDDAGGTDRTRDGGSLAPF